MRIAAGLARELGVECPLAESAVAIWERAVAELADSADHTEIARWTFDRATDRQGAA